MVQMGFSRSGAKLFIGPSRSGHGTGSFWHCCVYFNWLSLYIICSHSFLSGCHLFLSHLAQLNPPTTISFSRCIRLGEESFNDLDWWTTTITEKMLKNMKERRTLLHDPVNRSYFIDSLTNDCSLLFLICVKL